VQLERELTRLLFGLPRRRRRLRPRPCPNCGTGCGQSPHMPRGWRWCPRCRVDWKSSIKRGWPRHPAYSLGGLSLL